MKNTSSFKTSYLSEVLGIKNYLCPKPVYSLRALKGGLPCLILIVVFKPPSSSQKALLKKIMASIDVFEFSFLEIKDNKVLAQLLSCKESLADSIIFFGGEEFVKKDLLTEQTPLLTSENQKSPLGQESSSFLQLFSLEELDGNSPEIINRKKQVWTKLKQWKKVSGV